MCMFNGIHMLARKFILLVCSLFINKRFLQAVNLINIHFVYFRDILTPHVIMLGSTFILV